MSINRQLYKSRILGTSSVLRLSILILYMSTITLPLLVNLLLLRGQVDSFYSTTVVQTIGIIESGYLSSFEINTDMNLPNWYWQGHTIKYTTEGLVAPALTLSMLSLVTGLEPMKAIYIPVTQILSVLCIILISKRLMNKATNNILKSLSISVALYIWISSAVIGRFYTLQYHSYSLALYLLNIFLILYLVLYSNRIFQVMVSFIMLYTTLTMTHYRAPYALLGGIVGIGIILIIMKFLGKEKFTSSNLKLQIGCLILFSIMITNLYNFYSAFIGGRLDLGRLLYGIFTYIHNLREPVILEQEVFTPSPFYVFASKLFTYLGLLCFLLCFFTELFTFSRQKRLNNIIVLLLFSYVLFSSLIGFIAYLYAYPLEHRFGFNDPWLIILLSASAIPSKRSSKIGSIWRIIVIAISIALITCGIIISNENLLMRASYNPLTPPPQSIENLAVFLTCFTDPNKLYVTMSSLSTASSIYAHISSLNYQRAHNMIVANIYVNHENILATISIIKRSTDLVVLSTYDLNYGLFMDVFPTKSFVQNKIVEEVSKHLSSEGSLIYNNSEFISYHIGDV